VSLHVIGTGIPERVFRALAAGPRPPRGAP
jgi:hypothetical protein